MILSPKTCSECGVEFVPASGRQARCDGCRPALRRAPAYVIAPGYRVPSDAIPAPGSPEVGAITERLVAASGSVPAAVRLCALAEVEYRRLFPGAPVSKYLLAWSALRAFPGQLEALRAGE